MKTQNLSTLQIHKLTREQYFKAVKNGTIDETAIYLTPDEEIDLDSMELITNDDIDVICGSNIGIGGSGSVGAVSAEPDLVINLNNAVNYGQLYASQIEVNWEDVVYTYNKHHNEENVKVVIKGIYSMGSGSDLLVCINPFAVSIEEVYRRALVVHTLLPSGAVGYTCNCNIIFNIDNQTIDVQFDNF